MSELYSVVVENILDEKTCILKIKVIHPDGMKIPVTPGFALMLLQDSADGEPLSTMVDSATMLDSEWTRKYARGFVERIELLSLKNEMPEDAENSNDHEFWNNTVLWPEARLRIEVTHPAWMCHLKKNNNWETVSFDPARLYDPCRVIKPEDADKNIIIEKNYLLSEGFLPVPKILLLKHSANIHLDEIVYMPCYNLSSYESYDMLEDDELMEFDFIEWADRPVMWSHYGTVHIGILIGVDGDTLRLISNFHVELNADVSDIEWISRVAFRKGKNLQRQILKASDMLQTAQGAVINASVKTKKVSLKICIFNEASRNLKFNETKALEILAAPLTGYFEDLNEDYPLGAALNYEIKKRSISGLRSLYKKVAKGYISDVNVSQPDENIPDFDAISREELVAFYEKKEWPVYTVEIEATDAFWLKHCNDFSTYPCGLSPAEKPLQWRGETRKWKELKIAAVIS